MTAYLSHLSYICHPLVGVIPPKVSDMTDMTVITDFYDATRKYRRKRYLRPISVITVIERSAAHARS